MRFTLSSLSVKANSEEDEVEEFTDELVKFMQ